MITITITIMIMIMIMIMIINENTLLKSYKKLHTKLQ